LDIVYFYQYFSTPKGSWGTRVYEFASEWVREGHNVTVVSSVYSKSDVKATRFIEEQVFDGIRVKVINVSIDNKQPFLKRIWTFIQYAMVSSWFALTLKADIVIASSGPITVGLPGLLAHYIRRRTLVFETRDLWPEGAIELGIIKNPLLKKVAYGFERLCYKSSRLIVTLSPGMKTYIQEKHNHPNVISITNAANIELFSSPSIFPNSFSILTPLKYAIYTGNIGEVNNSYWLFETAKELTKRGRSDIIILLVGEGKQREELEQAAEKQNLKNFIRLGLMPKKDLIPLIQHALVSLVPLKGTPVLDTSSPNKFFESLAAGVPVVQNTKGWMKDFLDKYKVGFTLDPNSASSLADCLIELDANPSIREAMAPVAMNIAKSEFDKNILAKKMLEALETIHNQ
jgi:glycosyltransferase involved in cell wall biosynthesis